MAVYVWVLGGVGRQVLTECPVQGGFVLFCLLCMPCCLFLAGICVCCTLGLLGPGHCAPREAELAVPPRGLIAMVH